MTEVRMREIEVEEVFFGDLKVGDWFYYRNKYFLKIAIDAGNAFCVSTSEHYTLELHDFVVPLNADIVFSYA